MRTAEPRENTTTEANFREPLRPRDYWIYDQVFRRKRTQEDVAEDVGISQARISQICSRVRAWMDRMWDECVPEVDEERMRFGTYLANLRREAIEKGWVPESDDHDAAISRCLNNLMGISEEMPEPY